MEPLVLRIASTAIEAVIVGVALAGVLMLVRRIQIAFGVKDHTEPKQVHLSGTR